LQWSCRFSFLRACIQNQLLPEERIYRNESPSFAHLKQRRGMQKGAVSSHAHDEVDFVIKLIALGKKEQKET